MVFGKLLRITEWFRLEGTFKGHLVQTPGNGLGNRQVDQTLFDLALNTFRDGALTSTLDTARSCVFS